MVYSQPPRQQCRCCPSSSAEWRDDRCGSSRLATPAHKGKTLYRCGLPRTTSSYDTSHFSTFFLKIISVVDIKPLIAAQVKQLGYNLCQPPANRINHVDILCI